MADVRRGVPRGLRRAVRAMLSLGAAIAVAALALLLTDIGCVFKLVTGLSCPGCGMTRAWLAALRLDFPAALAYHPLFWVIPLAVALACAAELPSAEAPRHARRVTQAALIVLIVLLLAVWVVRIADGADAGLLFGGQPPAGVPADIVGWSEPRLVGMLRGLGVL